jgi:L-malate glycosyltransferase
VKPIVHLFNSSIVSGPETLVLPALPGLGRRVIVIFLAEARREQESRGPIEYARSLGLETRAVTVRSRIDFKAIGELRKLLREIAPQVVHAHDVKASTYLAASGLGRRRSYRIFSTHHGVRGRSGWKAKAYESFYCRLVLPFFDRILTVCSSDRSHLARRGVALSRIRVHLNGVDRRFVAPEERQREAQRIRAAWGLRERGVSSNSLVVGFLGRIAPEKRLDRILDLCVELSKLGAGLEWRLVVFGRGPLEEELKQRTSLLGLTSRVLWMGYRAGVGDELAGFDVLLSYSDAEGLPINLIEAGWAGTPVFATAVDGNLDLIPSRAEGWLVPVTREPAEAARELLGLLKDSKTRAEIGKKFQERVRDGFSGKRWLQDLRKLYEEP